MPVVTKVSGGVVHLRSLDRQFGIGDQADVSDDLAAYLCDERGDFERADGDETEDFVMWHDWNETDWLDADYQQRASDVRGGHVDDYLDEIEAAETSETVLDAVDERRDELED